MRAAADGGRLPDSVAAFLSGTDLAEKVGQAIVLTTAEPDGWPRLALLSVGEVVAVSDSEIRMALYATSRTTQALTATGRGLLTAISAEGTFKIYVTAERVALPDTTLEPVRNVFFRAAVDSVESDVVSYARVRTGIEYELLEEAQVLERWQSQIDVLTGAGWE